VAENDESGWTREDLRAWRERLGWTQQRAADELRMHLYALRNVELGKRPVRGQMGLLAELIERRERGMLGSAADAELLAVARTFAEATTVYIGGAAPPPGTSKEELLQQVNAAAQRQVDLLYGAGRTTKYSEAARELAETVQWLAFGGLRAHDECLRFSEEEERRRAARRRRPPPAVSEPTAATVGAVADALIDALAERNEQPRDADPMQSTAQREEPRRDPARKSAAKPTRKAMKPAVAKQPSPEAKPVPRKTEAKKRPAAGRPRRAAKSREAGRR
jgi:transcriptional regulator with XRE-family HTH domain